MFSLHATINYPDDEKDLALGPERMTMARLKEEVHTLILREPAATSFVFSVVQHNSHVQAEA